MSACDHHYCFECQFREPLLPIHCRQCRDRVGLVPALQLRTLVHCYHNLCHLLATFYPPGLATGKLVIATGGVSPHPSDGCDPIAELLKEASSAVYKCPPSVFRVKVPKEPPFPTGLDHSSAASLPGSPCLGGKSQQPIVGSTQSDTPAHDPPLMRLEVKQAHTCDSSPPPSVASTPGNPEDLGVDEEARAKQRTDQDLGVDGEARAKQRTDEGMTECSDHKTDLPVVISFTTSTGTSTSMNTSMGMNTSTSTGTSTGMNSTSTGTSTVMNPSTGMKSVNDTCIELPVPIVAKRRKVNRSWK